MGRCCQLQRLWEILAVAAKRRELMSEKSDLISKVENLWQQTQLKEKDFVNHEYDSGYRDGRQASLDDLKALLRDIDDTIEPSVVIDTVVYEEIQGSWETTIYFYFAGESCSIKSDLWIESGVEKNIFDFLIMGDDGPPFYNSKWVPHPECVVKKDLSFYKELNFYCELLINGNIIEFFSDHKNKLWSRVNYDGRTDRCLT
jgi:hypothetical protein